VPHPSTLSQFVAEEIAKERQREAHNTPHELQRALVRASLLWSARQDPETHRRWA
jgi:hypothetical protein